MDWIEVSLTVDGEAAEAVADVLRRYGHQGVLIEQAGFDIEVWPWEVPPAKELIVRAYFPADDRAEDKKQQLREAIWHMSRLYPMPEPEFKIVQDENWLKLGKSTSPCAWASACISAPNGSPTSTPGRMTSCWYWTPAPRLDRVRTRPRSCA
jgi:ribosomal protein L11 methylase PrmA